MFERKLFEAPTFVEGRTRIVMTKAFSFVFLYTVLSTLSSASFAQEVETEAQEVKNAAVFYMKALEILECSISEEMEAKLQATIEKGWQKDHHGLKDLLIQNINCLCEFKKGLYLKKCDFHFEKKYRYLIQKEVPPLKKLNQVGNLLLLEGRYYESQKKDNEAVDAYLSCLAFVSHIAQDRSLISRAISFRLEQMAYLPLREYLLSENSTRKTCQKIFTRLEGLEKGYYPARSLVEEERDVFMSILQMLADGIDPDGAPGDENKKKVIDFKREIIKQGRLLSDKHFAMFVKAAESNKKSDWELATKKVKELKETTKNYSESIMREFNNMIKKHPEAHNRVLAEQIVKITFLASLVEFRPAVDQYYQTIKELNSLKSLAQVKAR